MWHRSDLFYDNVNRKKTHAFGYSEIGFGPHSYVEINRICANAIGSKQADRIFWGIAFCTSLKLDNLVLLRGLMTLYGTHAGKMCKCAQTILSYRQKKWKISILVEFEVFKNICSLRPCLAIPMLQIIIKHLKVSLIVYFLRGLTFLRSLLALTIIWRACITALLMARDPDKYTELQYFSIPAIIICSVLSERLGNWWGKTSGPVFMKNLSAKSCS